VGARTFGRSCDPPAGVRTFAATPGGRILPADLRADGTRTCADAYLTALRSAVSY
jgi:hypothetical protein